MVREIRPSAQEAEDFAKRSLNAYLNVANRRGYKPIFKQRKPLAQEAEIDAEISYSLMWRSREPETLGAVINQVMEDNGWVAAISRGKLLDEEMWEEIVGPQIAQHASIEKLEGSMLTLSADSSAWAAQLRILAPQLITRIHEVIGQNLITELKVSGPAQKSWTKGKRSVKWRGPRDTYG